MAQKKYSVESTGGGDVAAMCAELLGRLNGGETIVRLVFFGDPADNAEYSAHLATINTLVGERFGDRRPAVTYVAQRPLQGEFKMETTALARGGAGGVGAGSAERAVDAATAADIKYGAANYLVVEDGTGRELIVGGIVADDLDADATAQSENVFARLRSIMDAEGFPVNSIVRQWNYVEGITGFDGERQHYQDFNDARSRFYATTSWSAGYPAATGIGTRTGGIMVELDALIKSEGVIDIPIDNALQVAAHSYSQDVLLGAADCELKHKTTPKFERARLIGYPDNATVYISGTAAIRGEGSLTRSDVAEQTRVTMENIEFLCSPDNIRGCFEFATERMLGSDRMIFASSERGVGVPTASEEEVKSAESEAKKPRVANSKQPLNSRGEVITGRERTFELLRVYIKNPDHLDKVREYMDAYYAGVPKFYLCADVCRTELLVEIEGVATIK